MSGDRSVGDEEKKHLIETSFTVDRMYLTALDRLRRQFEEEGIDIETREGRRLFVRAVRELNNRFV